MAVTAIHIGHRDDEMPPRVIGPFADRADATAALNDKGWERDERGFECWHHPDEWAYVARVVPLEPEV